MRKVLFFTHSLVGGGAEKTIITLSEYINKNYCDVEAHIGVVYDDARVRKTLQNVHVLTNKTKPEMKQIAKVPIILKQVMELRKLKKELRIDTCISFLPGADFLNVLSAVGEKRIISVRNKESFFATSFLKKRYIKFCYDRCDKIVAISQRVKKDIITSFGVKEEKVIVIYNPAPVINYTNGTSEEFNAFCNDNKIILNAGRLTEQKGQAYLIRAFAEVYAKRKDVRLVILGTGELETEVKKLVYELNLNEVVLFPGFVYNPYDYIKKADIFVFSSIVEGLGNILIECMACGIPIISTDCDCGPREILAPNTDIDKVTTDIEFAQNGILVPVCYGDTNSKTKITDEEIMMSKAILALLDREELQQSYKESSIKRLEDFEISRIVSQWISLVNQE